MNVGTTVTIQFYEGSDAHRFYGVSTIQGTVTHRTEHTACITLTDGRSEGAIVHSNGVWTIQHVGRVINN